MVHGETATKDTCYTPDILTKIKSEYNHLHRNDPIRETEPEKVVEALKARMSQCGKEDCWLNQLKDEKLRKKIRDYVFAPKRPKEWNYNPNEWLSNYDIFNVLTQYEDRYPHFEFIGPSFIDFAAPDSYSSSSCVTNELCQFSLSDHIKKKHHKIAIVFNLDKHTGPGTHWVSMFIDIKTRFIFYFDSAGDKTPPEIMRLVKLIQKQALELPKSFHMKFIENYPLVHQYTNTECGMYSLFFIITMLLERPDADIYGSLENKPELFTRKHSEGGTKTTTFDRVRFFRKHRIPDKAMQNLRQKYFNK